MTEHLESVFSSRALVTAFQKAIDEVRKEHHEICESMYEMEEQGQTANEDYIDPAELNTYYTLASSYLNDINDYLPQCRDAYGQEDLLDQGTDVCAEDILHVGLPVECMDTLIRVYELTDSFLRKDPDAPYEWHDRLQRMIQKMQLDYNAYDALCALNIDAQRMAGGACDLHPTLFAHEYPGFLRENPEVVGRPEGQGLTEDEREEMADRVDERIEELLEPFQQAFGGQDIYSSYAWFVTAALKLHSDYRDLPEPRKLSGNPTVSWQDRITQWSKNPHYATSNWIREQSKPSATAKNDNFISNNIYADESLREAAKQTIASIFEPFDLDHHQLTIEQLLCAKEAMERKIKQFEEARDRLENSAAASRA